MNEEYYLGLDMGTNSVGWAVTNPEYKLVRKSGKDLWGIREFDKALTSVDRRSKRTNRRRLQREKVRVGLLKEYFDEEIRKSDPLFYVRMDNSNFFLEDKDERLESLNGIFDDENYNDADYYKDYPTIFHLRKALIEDRVPHDEKYARLVYLALLNAFKHRGHFLNEGLSGEGEGTNTEDLFVQLEVIIADKLELNIVGDKKALSEILADRNLPKSQKAEKMSTLYDNSDKKIKEILKGICGLKFDVKKIYEEIDAEEKIVISFSDASYEDKSDDYLHMLGQSNFDLIEIMKLLYDVGLLSNILKGEKYLSFACVKTYEKHAEDLAKLKTLYRVNQAEYDAMFRMDEPGSYSAYIGSNINRKYTGEKASRRKTEGRKKDDLYKNIKKFLSNVDDKSAKEILDEIEKGTFLPKLRTSDNGVIPNQVHLREVKAILKNAEKDLEFLNDKNEYGLTVSEQIQQLFAFRIPYYIGPTSGNSAKHGGNGWVVRKEAGPVLPWNIKDKVDVDKTQEAFIKNLIRECTYISGEKVLPKNSLMYEAYCVLNEINNICVDGERISVELKQDIFNEKFKTKNKVSRKDICKYLVGRGVIENDSQITGIDTNINNSLSTYNRFKGIFGEAIETDSCKQMCERIAELGTIFGDSKKTFAESLRREFGEKLSEEQIKKIQGLKFRDWGRLSKELFNLQGCNPETGEKISLFRALWETNYNFMELVNKDEFMFKDELEKKQKRLVGTLSDFTADDLKDYYFSAPVRRMIWQTILVIKEISKIMGENPSRVFIEMTRSEDEKKGDRGRKDSRGKQLQELYKNIKDDSKAWISEIKAADANGSLRSKKLFLYYLQMGRCAYTNEPIDLDELMSSNSKYDIDHIYPRHYVKDDNILNNLVLVKKESNAYKSDDYPLMKMETEVYDLWRTLHEKKLMNDEKYKRLTSKQPFSEEQLAGFIARQLVETSQGTKGVADILKMILPSDKTKIIYVKGSNVSEFRNKYNLLKSRALNDFHHAKDAYLNIVVGNAYYTKFTQNPRNFISKEYKRDIKKYHYNLGKMFEWDIERDGYTAWVASKDDNSGTIKIVKSAMGRNTPMISRLTFEAKGKLYDETLYSVQDEKADAYVPLKTGDSRFENKSRYGGYKGVSGAYFFLVEHTKKEKRIRTLESMPVYVAGIIKCKSEIEEYCKSKLGYINPVVKMKKINMQSLIVIDGFYYRISGKADDSRIRLRNEVSLCLNQAWSNYIHYIEKFVESGRRSVHISEERNLELYDVLIEKYKEGFLAKRKNYVGEVLADGRKKYKSLDLENQCLVMMEILKLSRIGTPNANLSVIGGSTDILRINKNLSKVNECKLISQSVTGFYEKEINLLTV